ncbi:putative membrane protein [Halalkaliarchaeum sp. AArc-CO]|uniref:hypothetical protein n=1 Tax=unclassified Halalkaliarchaeum TaxID=2678344 RepID=UPI00217DD54B|nr:MULTISPECIES: hypothetical protein [unclassified Halalkaliarchaeum]MDR5672350.1 hypothetical protein [Halalkaliarchaeum sp. AArc-GB]UWG50029.1 putative membrane protein [Halalkaliarchaeum sp. AArc-CO]
MQPSREREETDAGAGESVEDIIDESLLDDDLLEDGPHAGGSSRETGVTEAPESAPDAAETTDGKPPLVGTNGRLFSGKATLLAILLTGIGMFLGGAIPLIGGIGRFVGLFLAAFLVGLVLSERRYLETGLVGAGAATVTVLSGFLGGAFLPVSLQVLQDYGVSFAIVAAAVGLVLAVVGHYLGRDLRDGLSRDLE